MHVMRGRVGVEGAVPARLEPLGDVEEVAGAVEGEHDRGGRVLGRGGGVGFVGEGKSVRRRRLGVGREGPWAGRRGRGARASTSRPSPRIWTCAEVLVFRSAASACGWAALAFFMAASRSAATSSGRLTTLNLPPLIERVSTRPEWSPALRAKSGVDRQTAPAAAGGLADRRPSAALSTNRPAAWSAMGPISLLQLAGRESTVV